MRCPIVPVHAEELVYEIRQIALLAWRMERAGVSVIWENIGDPVAKGELVPDWIIEYLVQVAREQRSWGYSPTKGENETRVFLAERLAARRELRIDPENIYFYNGVGDAVANIYGCLNRNARVLIPSPSYSIHASHESFHVRKDPFLYHLDPANGWLPDPEEIRTLVARNDEIAGVLLINPDNPTGLVWPGELVQEVVEIAARYGLFVIADEIYNRLAYNGKRVTLLADVIGDVPGISLKGISKEYPWPGGRCGWMEVYNESSDPEFKSYVRSLFDAKMIEVCATTQPQLTIPLVYADPRYDEHLKRRCAAYAGRALEFEQAFEGLEGVYAVKPDGAFYASVIFKEGMLNECQSLPVENAGAKAILDEILAGGVSPDKRLVLYLLAATGICLVPMTGFTSTLPGFRLTLLEQDDNKRAWIFSTLREKIEKYLVSA
ncbi:MAG TPA: pyridoxal phosphate-dependent aminotransferase [archaeon]|nr:pyridoxal phosphate-dependent aminotransferase [archaeon]